MAKQRCCVCGKSPEAIQNISGMVMCVPCYREQQEPVVRDILSPEVIGEAFNELRKAECVRDGNFLILDGHYEIDLNRCDTPTKILDWVAHLSEKTWITPLKIACFIDTACAAIKLKLILYVAPVTNSLWASVLAPRKPFFSRKENRLSFKSKRKSKRMPYLRT